MPRKKSRKKHSVKASFRVMELAKAGSSIELEIFASTERIGTLEIGRDLFEWHPNLYAPRLIVAVASLAVARFDQRGGGRILIAQD